MLSKIIINGKIKNCKKASILIHDRGFYDGYAVYETLITYNHKILLLNEHFKRMQQGIRILNIKNNISVIALRKYLNILIQKNPIAPNQEYRFRIIVTPTSYIITSDLVNLKKNSFKLLSFYNERSIPQIKHFNFLDACYYQQLAYQKKYDEALFYDCHKNILECACANIFIVKKNVIYTPKKDKVLLGITRDIIFKLVKNKIKIIEKNINLNAAKNADEIFITQTTRGITPVCKVDNQKIKHCPGPVTKELIFLYKEFTKQSI
jgi:branched-subunit amino acid aminotransferase/4-amino-4-deoxychorismate lyase